MRSWPIFDVPSQMTFRTSTCRPLDSMAHRPSSQGKYRDQSIFSSAVFSTSCDNKDVILNGEYVKTCTYIQNDDTFLPLIVDEKLRQSAIRRFLILSSIL